MVKTKDEAIEYIAKEICEKHTEKVTFSCVALFDMTDAFKCVIEKRPELILCVEALRVGSGFVGLYRQITVTVIYTDVHPRLVYFVDSEAAVMKVMKEASGIQKPKACIVFHCGMREKFKECISGCVSDPECINNYLYSTRTVVKSYQDCSVCGIEVEMKYSSNYTQKLEHKKKNDEEIDKIVALAKKAGIEDWKRAFKVMEYCSKNWTYDGSEENILRYTAYGALCNKRAVCMGMSLAICQIFERLNIPCRYIRGKRQGEGHAWNMVYLKGGWFYIDVTDMVCSRNPFRHWGVTEFNDREFVTVVKNEIKCNCDANFIRMNKLKGLLGD